MRREFLRIFFYQAIPDNLCLIFCIAPMIDAAISYYPRAFDATPESNNFQFEVTKVIRHFPVPAFLHMPLLLKPAAAFWTYVARIAPEVVSASNADGNALPGEFLSQVSARSASKKPQRTPDQKTRPQNAHDAAERATQPRVFDVIL